MHDIITGEAMCLKSIPSGMQVRTVNKMWVCTFLKSGAEELEKALVKQQSKYGYTDTSAQISFSTLDAEFKRCLNAMGVNTPIGDSSKLYRIFTKAVSSCGITRKGASLNSEDYKIIMNIVDYYRGRLDDKKYQHPNCEDYTLTPKMLDLLVNQFATLRSMEGVMDFAEITELLYKYLYVTPNENVQKFVSERYNYIYIDEFQDTSQIQYAIIKYYARGKLWINNSGLGVEDDNSLYTGEPTVGKITVMGDPSQCIYSFKGSDSKILVRDFDDDFKPVLSTLSYNWRCPQNILKPIVPSIHLNVDSANQKILSNKEGGIIEAYAFGGIQGMLTQLKVDLEQDMKEGNSVAILCRTNFDGIIPAFMLESDRNFNFSISGANMTLSNSLPRKLLGITSLFTERSSNTVKNSLCFFVRRYMQSSVRDLMNVLKMNSLSIWTINEEDLFDELPDLEPFISGAKNILFENKKKTPESELKALIFTYKYLRWNVFRGNTSYADSARAYIDVLLYILENKKFDSIFDFVEDIELLDERLHARVKKQNMPIRIATVHEFKGKEADSVYIWNDSLGVFPSNKCDLNNLELVEEERRVHYIACTRAKKREHIYTLQGKVGKFLSEMDLEITMPQALSTSLKKTVTPVDESSNESANIDSVTNEIIQEATNDLNSANEFVSIVEE